MSIYTAKYSQDNKFYVYMYLRKKDSINGLVGTPYYIGKGFNNRAFNKHQKGISVPKDRNQIKFISENMKEKDAFILEIYLIELYGRVDLGTGCLRNRTDGGDGATGRKYKFTEEQKAKLRKPKSKNGKANIKRGIQKSWETGNRVAYNKGMSMSDEQKFLISKRNKGRKRTAEFCKTRSLTYKGRTGTRHTEETKEKLRQFNLNRPPCSDETIQKLKLAFANKQLKKCPYCGVLRLPHHFTTHLRSCSQAPLKLKYEVK